MSDDGLMIFVADAGHKDRREWCINHGVGLLMSPEYATIPPPNATFMLDNGAFYAFKRGEPWDESAFYHMLGRFAEAGRIPYGVVVPDIVMGGMDSLNHSSEHIHRILGGIKKYLAVQDGMVPENVDVLIPSVNGVFVGGSVAWKWRTAKTWAEYAHKNGKKCHIGRVGTIRGFLMARAVGADSVDGSNLSRNRKLGKILEYREIERTQKKIECSV